MENINIVLVIVSIWLLALTGVVVWSISFFGRLTKGVKENNLIKVLNKVLTSEEKNRVETKKTLGKLRELEKEVELHVQKVGLVRFNPFKEIGGDHSFSLALLNGKDSGIVITGLHTRDRTRIYIKPIQLGVSKHKLSKEEQKALKEAG